MNMLAIEVVIRMKIIGLGTKRHRLDRTINWHCMLRKNDGRGNYCLLL